VKAAATEAVNTAATEAVNTAATGEAAASAVETAPTANAALRESGCCSEDQGQQDRAELTCSPHDAPPRR
jgi:hypothetical protein